MSFSAPPIVAIVIVETAKYFGITKTELLSFNRTPGFVLPRQVAMYICRNITKYSLPEIGLFFGKRDHSTVHHSIAKVTKMVADEEYVRIAVEHITEAVKKIQGTNRAGKI